ncbi:MAG TPA: DUF1398 family protein [Allosphingosinicella sp.]|nr:DUF1398 family protein [Allosphingosinicella sp.]
MNDRERDMARRCLKAAEADRMTFPQIVGALMEAGFESYAVDFRTARATYYRPDGDSLDLAIHRIDTSIAPQLDASLLQAAIREAQQLVAGYTYKGFCEKAAAAGCAGYLVSFSGRRALYVGRDAQTHVEHFPD